MTTNCFLCQPNNNLLVYENKTLFALVGLGPITPRYFVIASKQHIGSFADAFIELPAITQHLEEIRKVLSLEARPILLTEHGRVPVCRDDGGEHEANCFHAHLLAFQPEKNDESQIRSYFGESVQFDDLASALTYATQKTPYFLYSESPKSLIVYTTPLNVPPQFFRKMIAIQNNHAESADWRDNPKYADAVKKAKNERTRITIDNG